MASTFAINRNDKPDSDEEWDSDLGTWVGKGKFRHHTREAAEAALPSVAKKYKPVITEIDEAWEDDPEIDDDGYPGDL